MFGATKAFSGSVSNLDAAKKLYGETLGLKVSENLTSESQSLAARSVSALLPSSFLELEEAGHWFHVEGTMQLNQAIDWLETWEAVPKRYTSRQSPSSGSEVPICSDGSRGREADWEIWRVRRALRSSVSDR